MTQSKTVLGIWFGYKGMIPTKITLRVTKDKLGRSLSLSSDDAGEMLQIPLTEVLDILRWVAERREE